MRLRDAVSKYFSRSFLKYGLSKAVVLSLASIEPQGFGESVSGVRRQNILNGKSKK